MCEDHVRLVSLLEGINARGPVWVCRADTVRPRQRTQWSCGHVNLGELLFLCGADSGSVRPGVEEVQARVDEAHRDGFDPEGYAELGLVAGTRKWVGTSEAAAVLRHAGVAARLGAFRAGVNCVTPAEALLGALRAHFASFFSGPSTTTTTLERVWQTGAPPAMLNWQGHSVLIAAVGAEDDLVVVYDPLDATSPPACAAASAVVPGEGRADIELCCADPRVPLQGNARRLAADLAHPGLALLTETR